MDEVEEVESVKREWSEAYSQTQDHIKAIGEYRKSGKIEEKNSLLRLNVMAQYGLSLLSLLELRLGLLARRLPTDKEVESAGVLLESLKAQSHTLQLNLRNANLQANANKGKSAQEERDLLLGGEDESTASRCNLQTEAAMKSAAESITENLHRTSQLIDQAKLEIERRKTTLMTIGQNCSAQYTGISFSMEQQAKDYFNKKFEWLIIEDIVNDNTEEELMRLILESRWRQQAGSSAKRIRTQPES
ncbi:hypothetical protein L6164_013192 [Bauhinia variegata]|uniref:Uncharacterized protein n=1 Tax=Bauhinia variegata TaxID=167791 RepID=A0ACB9PDI2_BAUVA|nr:hypothetical protein L6164_013192 [Bauhinia variegata]